MNHDTPLKARPTTYKGIRMRSRTEARYAELLDSEGLEWTYEPQCFADETGQYLPDFLIRDRGCRPFYVEVKGALPDDEVGAVLRRMEIVWSSDPDAQLLLTILSSGDVYAAGLPGRGREWVYGAGAA